MQPLDEKTKIILDQLHERIDVGEWDKYLNIPFATKKLLKVLVDSKMLKKIENGNNPIFSDSDMQLCVQEVRETAAYTAALFLELGFLKRGESGIDIGPATEKLM